MKQISEMDEKPFTSSLNICGEPEPVFLNVYGAQESIPRNEFRQPCSLEGRYDNPIPTRFLVPIDCLKIPALLYKYKGGEGVITSHHHPIPPTIG
jgi:hypothetical protein